jgi:methionyl-tRNA formyltransferase
MAALRLAFMGTPDFAVPSLAALIDAGHEIACVYTQPPRKRGRGHREQVTPVDAYATDREIPVRTPVSLKDPDEQAAFADLGLDAAVVVAYGLILPRPILAAPRLGCLNVHASLLPRWRGAAPIQRAILAGDDKTGVTIMVMDAGLDTGPMLLSEAVPIGPETTAPILHDELAQLGAQLLLPALAGYDQGAITPKPQPDEGVTYADKITRADGALTFDSAEHVLRQLRALVPWPGVTVTLEGETIKVLAADRLEMSPDAPPGTVIDDRLAVACGEGAVRLTRLQRAGRAPVDLDAFLRGFAVPKGSRLV